MRIVLVGRREAGNSVAGNTILVGELFPTALTKVWKLEFTLLYIPSDTV